MTPPQTRRLNLYLSVRAFERLEAAWQTAAREAHARGAPLPSMHAYVRDLLLRALDTAGH